MTPKPDHGEESYRGSGKPTGKRAVITGGDSGIGRAVAIAFAREGADVLISYLSEHPQHADTPPPPPRAGGGSASAPRTQPATWRRPGASASSSPGTSPTGRTPGRSSPRRSRRSARSTS